MCVLWGGWWEGNDVNFYLINNRLFGVNALCLWNLMFVFFERFHVIIW